METFIWGAIGALAPEIVRWFRIARSETPNEWKRPSFWVATGLYTALAGVFALLVAQHQPYAAFAAGITTEFAIMGVLSSSAKTPIEELSSHAAKPWTISLIALRRHAAYLSQNA